MSVMTSTSTEHPKVPALDTEKIRTDEILAVTRTLSIIEDPKARLEKAVAIIKDAEHKINDRVEIVSGRTHKIDGLDSRVKKLALSLALHEGARGISNAIPMTRNGFYALTERVLGDPEQYEKVSRKSGRTLLKTRYVWKDRPVAWTPAVSERATEKKVRRYRDAATELPTAAAELYAAQVRVEAASAERDQLVPIVVTSGVSAADVARMIERHPSRVSHLVKAAANQ